MSGSALVATTTDLGQRSIQTPSITQHARSVTDESAISPRAHRDGRHVRLIKTLLDQATA
jgi:hypothetical protein